MRTILRPLALTLMVLAVGCGVEEAVEPPTNEGDEVGWIEGIIDTDSGVVLYRSSRLREHLESQAFQEQALEAINEDRNGRAGSAAAARTAEFVVECNGTPCSGTFAPPGAKVNGCGTGVDSFEMDVTVRSFFPAGLAASHVEFTSVINLGADNRPNTNDAFEGADSRPCNSDPPPRNLRVGASTPVNSAFGIYRYGQLLANPSTASAPALSADTVRWKFRNPGGFIKFQARLIAEECAGNCTPGVGVPAFWQAEGAGGSVVNAAAEGDGVVYVGGSFNYVGPRTGAAGAVGAVGASNAGQAMLPWPPVEGGDVFAIVSDGAGGAYVGGSFTTVGGVARAGLARILADGTVDATFSPSVTGTVQSLLLTSSRLIVGGSFGELNGIARSNLGALLLSGATDISWTGDANGEVRALLLSGGTVIAGGAFTTLRGVDARRIARLDAATGVVDAAFSAAVEVVNGRVNALALGAPIDGDATNLALVIGGSFTTINTLSSGGRGGSGVTRQRLATVGLASLTATSFAPAINAEVNAVATTGNSIYLAGAFTSVAGTSRPRGALFNGTALQSWRPFLTDTAFALVVDAANNRVYVGGAFTSRLLALNGTTAAPQPWGALVGANNSNLPSASTVRALLLDGDRVVVGGTFRSVGGVTRLGAAALSLTTGLPTAWSPFSTQQTVFAVDVLNGGDPVVATAASLSRFSASGSGAVVWELATVGSVRTITVDDSDRVYLGGAFTRIGSSDRIGLAACSADGSLLAWQADLDPDGVVRGIALYRGEAYVGGDFATVAGVPAVDFAVVSPAPGVANVRRAWATNGRINSVTAQRDGVYVGGFFTAIDGVRRDDVAAVDGNAVTSFTANANLEVDAVAAVGNSLVIGGNQTTVSGQSCQKLCILNVRGPANGLFNAGLSGRMFAVASAGSLVVGGGGFTNSDANGGVVRTGVFAAAGE